MGCQFKIKAPWYRVKKEGNYKWPCASQPDRTIELFPSDVLTRFASDRARLLWYRHSPGRHRGGPNGHSSGIHLTTESTMDDDKDAWKKMPGLKEEDLAKLGKCAICRRPIFNAATGGLTFYVLTISHGVFVPGAIERQVGLSMVLGGGTFGQAIVRVMGPNEDLAKILGGPKQRFIHETCADEVAHLGMLLEGD